MKIVTIAMKEIKHTLRNKPVMLIMTAFPILLILILGTAFSSAMDGTSLKFEDTKVIYTIDEAGQIQNAFEAFTKEMEKSQIQFIKTQSKEEAIKQIKEMKYACYVEVDSKENTLHLYKNDRSNLQASFIEGVLQAFTQRYNLMAQIIKVNPTMLTQQNREDMGSYVKITSLDKKRQPRALDYYGVTMITLIILYASMNGAYAVKNEIARRTGERILISPLKKHEIFTGKVLGAFLISMLQITAVFLFSKYVIGVHFGARPGFVFLILTAEVWMAISLGVAIAYLIKAEGAMSGFLHTLIPFMVFLGGGYVPLEQFGSNTLMKVAQISPVRWVNDSVFNIIYGGNSQKVGTAVLYNIGLSLLFLVFSAMVFKKESAR